MATELTKEQFIQILLDKEITKPEDMLVFQTIYSFEGHKAYASQVGRILGIEGTRPASPVNLQIGRFAKRIAKKYDIGFTIRSNQKYKFWDVFFDGWEEGQFFVWQLKPNLIKALEEADLTNNKDISVKLYNMQYKNDIKKEYVETRESIRLTFPEAYDFLVQIEDLLYKGFYVGTHKNLHFYYKSSFLFYFSKISSRVIGFSSKYNGNIKNGTVNNSDYFFNIFTSKLADLKNDMDNSFEIDNRDGFKIIVNRTDKSKIFFKILLDSLFELSGKGNLLELSNEINKLANEQQIHIDFGNATDEKFLEGIQKIIATTVYERNPKAREECLNHWNYNCVVCGCNFENIYGELGKNYIHVHHINQISTIKKEYEINPIEDLRPVCPNCHAMLHKGKLTIEELKKRIK